MSWKIRHEGSPQSIDNLTLEQVTEGLLDGVWEPTDEVMGPNDTSWVAIERHPLLAEAAMDIEPPPRRGYDDETRLDMNALIDVTLVLLIFFIMTASYSILQKRMEAAEASEEEVKPRVVTKDEVKNLMIHVQVTMDGKQPVVRVEDQVVPLDRLATELSRYVSNTGHTRLLLEHQRQVPWGVVIQVQDDAKLAGFDRISLLKSGASQPKR